MLFFYVKHGGQQSKNMGVARWSNTYDAGRVITTVLKINRKKIVQSSVYFPHREYADHHVEEMYRCIEHYTKWRKHTTIIAVDLGPGIGTDRLNVGPYTLNESNKRGDRLKHGPMIPNFVALNTMFKKEPEQASYISFNPWERQATGLEVINMTSVLRGRTSGHAADGG